VQPHLKLSRPPARRPPAARRPQDRSGRRVPIMLLPTRLALALAAVQAPGHLVASALALRNLAQSGTPAAAITDPILEGVVSPTGGAGHNIRTTPAALVDPTLAGGLARLPRRSWTWFWWGPARPRGRSAT
jgi:hypothetical protein